MNTFRADKIRISVYNPLLMLSLSWLSILILYILNPIGILYSSNGLGVTYILFLIFISLFVSLSLGLRRIYCFSVAELVNYSKKTVYTKALFFFITLELLLKGIPPIFTGADYATWGISGLHGFVNILGLFVSYSNFLLFMLLKANRKKHLIVLSMVFLWQIFVLNRAIIMLNGIGLLYMLICLNKFKLRHLILACFSMIYLMGLVGDLRGHGGEYIYFITDPKPWAEKLGVGFVWVITYFTTAISNLMYNIETGKTFAFQPAIFLNEFLPNILKLDIPNTNAIKLYDGLFNASTLVRPSLVSFGVIGPIVTFALLISMIYFYYTRKQTFQWVAFMTLLSAASILSCYENTVFTPWVIFMFLVSVDFKLLKMM
jgi:hypothetical protein